MFERQVEILAMRLVLLFASAVFVLGAMVLLLVAFNGGSYGQDALMVVACLLMALATVNVYKRLRQIKRGEGDRV